MACSKVYVWPSSRLHESQHAFAKIFIRHSATSLPNMSLSRARSPVRWALWRLKGLIDDRDTPGGVLMAAIREVLDRTGYREYHEMTFDQIRPHMDRLIAEAEADMTPEELAAHLAKHGKSIA